MMDFMISLEGGQVVDSRLQHLKQFDIENVSVQLLWKNII